MRIWRGYGKVSVSLSQKWILSQSIFRMKNVFWEGISREIRYYKGEDGMSGPLIKRIISAKGTGPAASLISQKQGNTW